MVKLSVSDLLHSLVAKRRKNKRIKEKEKVAEEKEKRVKEDAENVLKGVDEAIITAGKTRRRGRPFHLLIGPTNSAGQADQWSRVLCQLGHPSQSLRISNDVENEWFENDLIIPRLTWTTLSGRTALARMIVSNYKAILIESMRPLFSLHTLRDYSAFQTLDDIDLLTKSKVKVGIVFHGSDIRDTQAHAKREKFSPYQTPSTELSLLQTRAREFRAAGRQASKMGIPVFVTSPDLLLDIPGAYWLPVVIDVEHFVAAGRKRPPWSNKGPMRVLFQPSRGWLKSAAFVEPILERLSNEGVIQLIPNDQIAHDLMADRMASADLIIDRFDGIAGVTSMEALAAGRVVIANVAKWAYKGAEATPPVLHATPDTLEATLRDLALKRGSFAWDTAKGLAYVHKWHDGRESAARIVKRLKL
jgi:hypothetical protein